jgi:hypothetical protein
MSHSEHMAWGAWPRVCALVTMCASAGALGCSGGQTADTADGSTGEGGSPGDDGGGHPLVDCGPPDAAFVGYATAAGGTVTGPNVNASICNAEAYLFQSRYSSPPGDYLLFLNSASEGSIALTSPPGASDGLLTGMMLVTAASPGTYTSSGACGFLTFGLSLPVPAGVVCTGTGPDCAPGCGSACSGFGCEPCTPMQPTVGYGANAPSDCLGTTQTVAGSWTVTLTSVVPYPNDDAGSNENGPHFVTHGTVTGTLPNGDGGTDMATITMGF